MRKRHEDRRERGSDQERDILESIPMDTPGPDRVVYGTQVRDRVNAALNELSAQERTAFVLRHFEGQSIEEIGAALGTGSNATKHSIFRAVQKLRKNLEPVVGHAR